MAVGALPRPAHRPHLHPVPPGHAVERLALLGGVAAQLARHHGGVEPRTALDVDDPLVVRRAHNLVQHPGVCGKEVQLGHGGHHGEGVSHSSTRPRLGAMELPPLAGADHVCAACGLAYPSMAPALAAGMIRTAPAAYRAALAGVPDAVARRRPDPATWSMVEYLCHVRDVFVVFAERIELARAEDRPAFAPLGNDERAVRLRYGEADVAATLDELAAGATRLAALIGSLRDADWGRTATRRPGEERDVLWMARQAAHEGRHHLADIERVQRASR